MKLHDAGFVPRISSSSIEQSIPVYRPYLVPTAILCTSDWLDRRVLWCFKTPRNIEKVAKSELMTI